MVVKVGINGFGRIGRLVLRAGWDSPNIKFCQINEISGGLECAAHLIEFDTIHGRFNKNISFEKNQLIIDHNNIGFSEYKNPSGFNWGDAGVDIVLDCTGQFKTSSSLNEYFKTGVKKVIVSAPIRSREVLNIVFGINEREYDQKKNHMITAASCTTNCLAPVVRVVNDNFGITHGSITSIHNVTNTQVMVDTSHKDLRRARSGLNSIIPTTTGSASAISMIFPELEGKINGHAVRIPSLNGSLTDCIFELKRQTNIQEVNNCFKQASQTYLKGILGFETRPLVSTDFVGDSRSAIIDALSTMVIDGSHLKVYAWYDNEWGYANRMVDLLKYVASFIRE